MLWSILQCFSNSHVTSWDFIKRKKQCYANTRFSREMLLEYFAVWWRCFISVNNFPKSTKRKKAAKVKWHWIVAFTCTGCLRLICFLSFGLKISNGPFVIILIIVLRYRFIRFQRAKEIKRKSNNKRWICSYVAGCWYSKLGIL